MIRVLHSVSNMDRAGIETMLMNYYRRIDREQIQFDFLVNKSKPGAYDDEIRSLGGNIYKSPGLSPWKYPAYIRFMKQLLSEHPDIKILHAHNEGMMEYALRGAKKAGLPTRIAHAHNTKIIKDYKWPLKVFCKAFIPYTATEYFGCGRDAGIYYFGKKRWAESGYTMHNAIDPEKFAFSQAQRDDARSELGIGDRFVIGHIGRFNLQKNHKRLVEIFAELTKLKPNAVLLLIGEGELEQQTRDRVDELGISDKVRFLGVRSDIPRLCMAMDVFLMPSLFEGLPVVGVEAQAAGVPCVFSREVTDEVVVLEESIQIPLSAPDGEWAQKIAAYDGMALDRAAAISQVQKAGYDINEETKKITKKYLDWAKSREVTG